MSQVLEQETPQPGATSPLPQRSSYPLPRTPADAVGLKDGFWFAHEGFRGDTRK